MAARQCAFGLSARRMPQLATKQSAVTPFVGRYSSTFPTLSTIGQSSRVRPGRNVRTIFGASALGINQSTRSISLWSGSKKEPVPTVQVEPSPDAIAREVEQFDGAKSGLDVIASDSAKASDTVSRIETHMTDATEKVQTLSDLGQLSSWPNVRYAQELLDWMVEATGLPWWATIALVTVAVRITILPVVFKGQANAIRLGNINPQMQRKMKDIQYAKSVGDQRLLQESAVYVQKLMKDNNCSPLKSFIAPAIQMPVFISFFFALRGLAGADLTSMKTGGLAWFTDLTVADPTIILPVASAAMTLAVLETGAEMGGAAQSAGPTGKMMRNVLRGFTVLSIPLLWNFPAAVFCFWATNNTFSLIQLIVLQLPRVRKALKLPEKIVPKEDDLSKEKPLSFWDSVSAGKASQEKARLNVKRDHIPSALQQKRSLEDGREAALQRIMKDQELDQPVSITSHDSSDTPLQPAISTQEDDKGDQLLLRTASTAREEQKNRRVEMARKKRAKQRHS
ncbi:hypothetical protein CBS101457_003521 [Exobasidium rhododendri]|nr:hypothetical protein CBS101457_003521 [Exobasidium rhododendri]